MGFLSTFRKAEAMKVGVSVGGAYRPGPGVMTRIIMMEMMLFFLRWVGDEMILLIEEEEEEGQKITRLPCFIEEELLYISPYIYTAHTSMILGLDSKYIYL